MEEARIEVEGTSSEVSALWLRPPEEWAVYVLAHGAGAGMRHPFLEAVAEGLATRGIGTLRYQFPYTEQGKRYPNPPKLLEATVRSAARFAAEASSVPLLAGGKSMG
ncbi:MAG: alpha/beta family hydrolase, partial [Thermoplasmata archaeon]|nr:alpha/beta family hydrolase [Thermoplasmata archaeon]